MTVFGRLVLCTLFCGSAYCGDITGEWFGTIKGTSYHKDDNSGGTDQTGDTGSSNRVERISATVTAKILATGSGLVIDTEIVTPEDKITFNFNGNVGNLAYWAQGVRQRDDGVETAFMSGHFTAKADKIVGSLVTYTNREVNITTYSLKKKSTATAKILRADLTTPQTKEGDSDAPFKVVGTAQGKIFQLTGTSKAAAFKGTITGDLTPATKTATFKFSDGVTEESFDVQQFEGGKAVVFTGMSTTETIFLPGPVGKESASGTGWVFGPSRMAEFKFKIQKVK